MKQILVKLELKPVEVKAGQDLLLEYTTHRGEIKVGTEADLCSEAKYDSEIKHCKGYEIRTPIPGGYNTDTYYMDREQKDFMSMVGNCFNKSRERELECKLEDAEQKYCKAENRLTLRNLIRKWFKKVGLSQ